MSTGRPTFPGTTPAAAPSTGGLFGRTPSDLFTSASSPSGSIVPARDRSHASTNIFGGTSTSLPTKESQSSAAKPWPKYLARKKYCFDDDFTVLVGQDEVRFVIHEDVFRDQSEFFRAACSRDFKEGKEKVIRMPEADPETFRSYMQWAYRGEIVVMNSQEIAEPNDQSSRLQRRLGELFTLASFLGDLQLKNSVTDKIISVLKCNSSELAAPLVTHLYEHTPDECKLRRYILDWFLYKPTGTWLETNRSLLPAAFLGDIAVGWAKVNFDRSKLIDPHTQPQCFYHERGTLTFFCPCNSSKT